MSEWSHPIWQEPTLEQAEAHAALLAREGQSVDVRAAWLDLENKRRARITAEKLNPLAHGYEPPIWRVADALLGLDWCIPEVFGKDYGARMRKLILGTVVPLQVLMIFGGNRSGKTYYMLKRWLMSLMHFERAIGWAFHQDTDQSRVFHQEPLWRLMPSEWKGKAIKSDTTYISFKMQTGFSESEFVTPLLSRGAFRNYAQDRMKIEGGLLGCPKKGRAVGMIADEECPEDWVDTLIQRLGEREARGVFGFTPVNGYTGVAKKFLMGAQVRWSSPGFLLNRATNKPDMDRAFFTEDCDGWLEKGPSEAKEFESLPRVMQCADRSRGILYFHTSDNQYGNPAAQYRIMQDKPTWYVKERFYGIANGQRAGKFPLFARKAHTMPRERVPGEGTWFMYCDPCEGRNFFMTWVKSTPDDRSYVTHEWPSQFDPVPGYGLLGEWAVPSGGKLLDGRPGPAQDNLGWSLIAYKREVARIEGWECYEENASDEDVVKWDQHGPKKVPVYARFLDSRYGNAAQLSEDGARTLFEEFDDIGLTFQETASGHRHAIDDGVRMINAALFYNNERPIVKGFNEPKLYVCSECENTIFAMLTWTGSDGGKAATKDPIDNLRWHFLKESVHVVQSDEASVAGEGCY